MGLQSGGSYYVLKLIYSLLGFSSAVFDKIIVILI